MTWFFWTLVIVVCILVTEVDDYILVMESGAGKDFAAIRKFLLFRLEIFRVNGPWLSFGDYVALA